MIVGQNGERERVQEKANKQQNPAMAINVATSLTIGIRFLYSPFATRQPQYMPMHIFTHGIPSQRALSLPFVIYSSTTECVTYLYGMAYRRQLPHMLTTVVSDIHYLYFTPPLFCHLSFQLAPIQLFSNRIQMFFSFPAYIRISNICVQYNICMHRCYRWLLASCHIFPILLFSILSANKRKNGRNI